MTNTKNTEENIIENTEIKATEEQVVDVSTPMQVCVEEVKEIKTTDNPVTPQPEVKEATKEEQVVEKQVEQVAKEPEKKLSFGEKIKMMAEKANNFKDKALEISAKATEIASYFKGEAKNTVEQTKEIKKTATEKIDETKTKVAEIKETLTSKPTENTATPQSPEVPVEKPKSFFERAKEMATKTIETGTNLLGKTVPYMKTVDEYEKVKQEDKFLAILFIKKDELESKKILMKMPIIVKNVWINGIIFKVIDTTNSQELSTKFNIEQIPTLIVSKKGEEKKRTTNIEEINKYLKDFTIYTQ